MNGKLQSFNSGRAVFFLLAIITVILVGAVLKTMSAVLLPFTISILLAIVTNTLVNFLRRFHIPRIISVLLVFLLLIGCLYSVGMLIYNSGSSIISLYPRYEVRLTEIYIWIARLFDLPYDEHLSIIDNLWGQVGVRNRLRIMTLSFSNGFIGFLRDAFMVALFMAFLLAEATFFKKKLDKAFEGTRAVQIKKITTGVMSQVTHYLSIKFFISVVNGVLVGIGLKIIGVEFAAVWGVIQFVMNFIPNIGSIAVGLAATAFSVIQFWPDPAPMIATGLVMLIVNVVLGCILDPKIMGDRLGLSPVVVLVSLLIWGYIWGFAGLIIAVPMMAIIKIICESIPLLEPISILMGSRKAVKAARSEEDRAAGNSEENQPEKNDPEATAPPFKAADN